MQDDSVLLIVIIISIFTIAVCLWIPSLYIEPVQSYPDVAIDMTEDFGTPIMKDPNPIVIKK